MEIVEILKEIINKLYDVEHCAGDWDEECKDILGDRCIACCRGHELIKELKIK